MDTIKFKNKVLLVDFGEIHQDEKVIGHEIYEGTFLYAYDLNDTSYLVYYDSYDEDKIDYSKPDQIFNC